jgi:hypothetical protein
MNCVSFSLALWKHCGSSSATVLIVFSRQQSSTSLEVERTAWAGCTYPRYARRVLRAGCRLAISRSALRTPEGAIRHDPLLNPPRHCPIEESCRLDCEGEFRPQLPLTSSLRRYGAAHHCGRSPHGFDLSAYAAQAFVCRWVSTGNPHA